MVLQCGRWSDRDNAASRTNNNVVDGDVDQLDKETNEAHDGKANGSGHSNLLELFAVGFGAALNQPDGILGKLATRFNESSDLIHFFLVYVREYASQLSDVH